MSPAEPNPLTAKPTDEEPQTKGNTMTTDETETNETEAKQPTVEEIAAAARLLGTLPEADRRAVAGHLAPEVPGADGKPLTPEEARELLHTNPERLHEILDAQSAGGPRLIEGV